MPINQNNRDIMEIFVKKIGLFRRTRVVTIETNMPAKDTPLARQMAFQTELAKYITLKDGKLSLTVVDKK